ncbi:MAG: sigma-70 family RNA polymerase sigma factor [Acidobacteria bacterium]|nr:MAG: sigma-70 family RNA polymerase sigma factor [Acidobacteriota bacterium]
MSWRDLTINDAERLSLARALDTDRAGAMALTMNEDEFRLFYDRNSRPLWAYLTRISGSREAADDLLQETFYRFLRANVTLENDAHRRHYLFRIATNLVRDGFRQSRTRPSTVEHDVELLAGTDRSADTADQRTDLNRAMAQLKPRERAMLWLAYAQGSSHREIAAVVGVKAESVKPLLFRARRKLAQLLGAER